MFTKRCFFGWFLIKKKKPGEISNKITGKPNVPELRFFRIIIFDRQPSVLVVFVKKERKVRFQTKLENFRKTPFCRITILNICDVFFLKGISPFLIWFLSKKERKVSFHFKYQEKPLVPERQTLHNIAFSP